MQCEPHLSAKAPHALLLGLLVGLTVCASGCGGTSQRLQQLQNENDRLLSEYRAQRDQVTQLNERLATLQNRLAESEKLLARQSPSPSTRLSRLNNDPNGFSGSSPRGTAGKPTSSTTNSAQGGAVNPSSSGSAGPLANEELYWRPMRREQPK